MKRFNKFALLGVLVFALAICTALPAWAVSSTWIVPVTAPTLQAAIAVAAPGDTILIQGPATYVEVGQIVISKPLTIIGVGRPIIQPSGNTGGPGSGQPEGWWYVSPAGHLVLKDVILDGNGPTLQIMRAIYAQGGGSIENCEIRHIRYGTYYGLALSLYSDWIVTHNFLWDIGRVGIHVNGVDTEYKVTDNIYVGKGEGDWLDYGIELERGAYAVVTNNIVSNCKGVASSDGSTSAGIFMSTFFNPGTTGLLLSNVVTDNTDGIVVGYLEGDTSTCIAHDNYIYDNTGFGVVNSSSTATVTATKNLWGTTDLATIGHFMVSGIVDYSSPSTFGAGQVNSQADVFTLISTPTLKATLTVQQDPADPSYFPKLAVQDNTGLPQFEVTGDGSVGVGLGLNYPRYKLDVSSGGVQKSQIHLSHDGSDSGGYLTSAGPLSIVFSGGVMYDSSRGGYIQKSSDGRSIIMSTGAAGGIRFSLQSGASLESVVTPVERLRIDFNGNVGINTSTPTQKLEVNGGVRLNTVTAKPTCDATVRGTLWFTQGALGTKDNLEVCAKDAGNAYAWRILY